MLDNSPRMKAAMELAASKAGWGQPVTAHNGGRAGRGIGLQTAFGSYIATVTEVEVDKSGEVHVRRVESFEAGPMLRLTGPGIETSATIAPAGTPYDFLAHWAENRARFPRGVDLILVGQGAVVGLPRTTRIGAA